MPDAKEIVLGASQGRQRLDAALAHCMPKLSLRARRRLWQSARILVNGIPCPPGYMVGAGDSIRLLQHSLPAYDGPLPRLVARHNGWLFFDKAAGLDTVALAGKDGHSLESLLGQLQELQELRELDTDAPWPLLCTRLDRDTSGLVVAASDAAARVRWRTLEDAGACEKIYLTVLCGHLGASSTATAIQVTQGADGAVTAKRALDTSRTAFTRLLPFEGSPLRHTTFTPLYCGSAAQLLCHSALAHNLSPALALALSQTPADTPLTCARAVIYKGARHQIRAHAASIGHPLWGDSHYGGGDGGFWLHHCAVRLPEYTVFSRLWPLWETSEGHL